MRKIQQEKVEEFLKLRKESQSTQKLKHKEPSLL